MNRERLKLVRDHLDGLPDEKVDMRYIRREADCGTVCCIAGWASVISGSEYGGTTRASDWLGLTADQRSLLFYAEPYDAKAGEWAVDLDLSDLTRSDAIAAIDSMLANPDDDALPVWPERVTA